MFFLVHQRSNILVLMNIRHMFVLRMCPHPAEHKNIYTMILVLLALLLLRIYHRSNTSSFLSANYMLTHPLPQNMESCAGSSCRAHTGTNSPSRHNLDNIYCKNNMANCSIHQHIGSAAQMARFAVKACRPVQSVDRSRFFPNQTPPHFTTEIRGIPHMQTNCIVLRALYLTILNCSLTYAR